MMTPCCDGFGSNSRRQKTLTILSMEFTFLQVGNLLYPLAADFVADSVVYSIADFVADFDTDFDDDSDFDSN